MRIPRLLKDRKGVTLLEMIVAATLFIAVLFQIGSMWSSFNRWVKYLTDRTNVDREARIARDFLISELVIARNVTLKPPSGWRLHLAGTGPGKVVKYWQEENFLVRRAGAAVHTFPAAQFLASSEFNIFSDESAAAVLTFQQGASQAILDVFMSKPE
jgi:hypothetical protein